MPGRRKNPKLERKRRERISRGLMLAYASGKRKKVMTETEIERLRNLNIGRSPWNKGKTVEKDRIYSPQVLRKMCLGQKYRFITMSKDERMKITENMRKAQLIRWQKYRERQQQEQRQQHQQREQ